MEHGRGGEERPHRQRAEGSELRGEEGAGGARARLRGAARAGAAAAGTEYTKGEPHSESSKPPGTKKRAAGAPRKTPRGPERRGPKSGGGGGKKGQAHREDARGEGEARRGRHTGKMRGGRGRGAVC